MPISVLSNTIKAPPENLRGKVEMYSGGISELISRLEKDWYTRNPPDKVGISGELKSLHRQVESVELNTSDLIGITGALFWVNWHCDCHLWKSKQ